METELKLQIDPIDIPRFRRYPLLRKPALTRTSAAQLNSIYFDTPDLYFKRHDCALRVRQEKRRWIQTLKKGKTRTAGLYQRDEWESPVDGPYPDLASLIAAMDPATKLARFLKTPDLLAQLEPIFHAKIRRAVWHVVTGKGDEIELALDQGSIESGSAKCGVNEVELELKAGNPGALFDLALDIQRNVPLRIGHQSKAELGYGLYAPQPALPKKSLPVDLASTASLKEAIEIVVGNCLEQIRSNETGVAQGTDPEYVHQIRVGFRRLRLALELFEEVAPHGSALWQDLEWAAAELGITRNWEVLALDTLGCIGNSFPDKPELEVLMRAARNAAVQQRRHAAVVIGSARYAQLLLRMGEWLQGISPAEAVPAGKHRNAPQPLKLSVKQFSARILRRYRKKLLRRGEAFDAGDPVAAHRVRIAGKKLHYATEFFQSLQAKRKTRSLAGPLSGLLSSIGNFHDMFAADSLLNELAQLDPGSAPGAHFARGYLAHKSEMNAKKMHCIWQHFIIESALKEA